MAYQATVLGMLRPSCRMQTEASQGRLSLFFVEHAVELVLARCVVVVVVVVNIN